MAELYFEHSNGYREPICEISNAQECMKEIFDHLKKYPHFKSYYQRIWTTPDDDLFHCPVTWIDVGSYTEFFCCTGLMMEDFSENKVKELSYDNTRSNQND